MILFISDLHLDSSRPGVTEAFLQFLDKRASRASALYILGDLFELWLGDDDDDPFAAQVINALRNIADGGTALFFIHGNRDFLIGEQFSQRAGITLLDEHCVIDLFGEPTLIMHGDTLCTLDHDYQRFRAQVRQAGWQQQILAKSLPERRALAQQVRQQSSTMNSRKPQDIMDVSPDEVSRIMQEYGVRRLIHGHTHRPTRHALTVDGHVAERIVLGDWDSQGWCLQATEDGVDLQQWVI